MRGEVSLQDSNDLITSLILELVDFKVAGIVIYCAVVPKVSIQARPINCLTRTSKAYRHITDNVEF